MMIEKDNRYCWRARKMYITHLAEPEMIAKKASWRKHCPKWVLKWWAGFCQVKSRRNYYRIGTEDKHGMCRGTASSLIILWLASKAGLSSRTAKLCKPGQGAWTSCLRPALTHWQSKVTPSIRTSFIWPTEDFIEFQVWIPFNSHASIHHNPHGSPLPIHGPGTHFSFCLLWALRTSSLPWVVEGPWSVFGMHDQASALQRLPWW